MFPHLGSGRVAVSVMADRDFAVIGKDLTKVDGKQLVEGRARFTGDFVSSDCLWGAVLYAKHPCARVVTVDAAEAEAMEGVTALLLAEDVPPGMRVCEKQQVLAEKEVRFEGEAIALVAAETERAARDAIKKIVVEYEVREGIDSLAESQSGARRFYEGAESNEIEESRWKVRKGSIGHWNRENRILDRVYRTGFVEHMYLEPETVLVHPREEGFLVVASAQSPYLIQGAVAHVLGLGMNRVQVRQPYIGGSFGGKNESVALLAARAALLAKETGRPVFMSMTREESMRASTKRHPMELHYRIEADATGRIQRMKARIASEGGAYAVQAPYVNWRGCVHACGCYRIPEAEVDIAGYYSNRPTSGAFRGFSSPQIIFAHESLLDELAETLQIDPLEFRKRNILREGDTTITGQTIEIDTLHLDRLLEWAQDRADYSRKRELFEKENGSRAPFCRGIGLSLSYRGCGFGAETIDASGAFVLLHKDGTVTLRMGLVDMGQGLHTAFQKILAEELGVRMEDVVIERGDTTAIPDGNFTSASRGTYSGGMAVLGAAQNLKKNLLCFAAEYWKEDQEHLSLAESVVFSSKEPGHRMSLRELAHKAFYAGVDLGSWFWHKPHPVWWDEEKGQGVPYHTYSSSVVVTEVKVETLTGLVTVEKVSACNNAGRIINPKLARSQTAGGIAMGIGMALQEEVSFDAGRIQNGSFHDYILCTAMDQAELDIDFLDAQDYSGPYGAKSLGETCSEAVAASVANAVSHAVGHRFYTLPIRPIDILLAKEGDWHCRTRSGS